MLARQCDQAIAMAMSDSARQEAGGALSRTERSAKSFGGTIAPLLAVFSLLLIPNTSMAQAPLPEEALDAVAEHLRDQTWVLRGGHLGFDSVMASRANPSSPVDAATHREILARIAEARELPFYPGADFGRAVCDLSRDMDWPGVNCHFSHGTRSILALTVVSSDEERGITRIDVVSAIMGSMARRSGDDVRAGMNGRSTTLDVAYDRDGTPQVIREGLIEFWQGGSASVTELRDPPPGR